MPPDTSAYMIGGYLLFFVVLGIYLLSLGLRWRNLQQELEILEEKDEKG